MPKIDDDGGIRITMREPDPNDPMPRGGMFVQADAASNLDINSEDILRLRLFDPGCDSLVINGRPRNDATLSDRITATESRGSMILLLPDGGAVILRGISVDLWREGASRQIFGSRRSETLKGTTGDDVFSPGWGDDTIVADTGNDSITYARDDLTISCDPPNLGDDVLDLRRFKIEELQITKTQDDITVTTPDGPVLLQGQLGATGNIEMILLSEDTSLTADQLATLTKP